MSLYICIYILLLYIYNDIHIHIHIHMHIHMYDTCMQASYLRTRVQVHAVHAPCKSGGINMSGERSLETA